LKKKNRKETERKGGGRKQGRERRGEGKEGEKEAGEGKEGERKQGKREEGGEDTERNGKRGDLKIIAFDARVSVRVSTRISYVGKSISRNQARWALG